LHSPGGVTSAYKFIPVLSHCRLGTSDLGETSSSCPPLLTSTSSVNEVAQLDVTTVVDDCIDDSSSLFSSSDDVRSTSLSVADEVFPLKAVFDLGEFDATVTDSLSCDAIFSAGCRRRSPLPPEVMSRVESATLCASGDTCSVTFSAREWVCCVYARRAISARIGLASNP